MTLLLIISWWVQWDYFNYIPLLLQTWPLLSLDLTAGSFRMILHPYDSSWNYTFLKRKQIFDGNFPESKLCVNVNICSAVVFHMDAYCDRRDKARHKTRWSEAQKRQRPQGGKAFTHTHTHTCFYTLLFPFLNFIFYGWYFWIVFVLYFTFRLFVFFFFADGSEMKVNSFFTFFENWFKSKKIIDIWINYKNSRQLQLYALQ